MRNAIARFVLALLALPVVAAAQFTIEGVTDKTIYTDSAQFRVPEQPGYSYAVFLNTNAVPSGQSVTIKEPDFYLLTASRTETASGAVTNRQIRFIIRASARSSAEVGIPVHTPSPVVQSSSNEFANAHFHVLVPRSFPAGYPLPIVTWAMDDELHAVRANGVVRDDGTALYQLRRGVGSGFKPVPAGASNMTLKLQLTSLQTNIQVEVESNVTWTTVSGILGNVTWPPNARIQVTGNITVPSGSTLTIGQGTVIRLNAGVDITNNGSVLINGTTENPVVFMPTASGQPWGGFVSKVANAGTIEGTGAIFTGAGAVPNWFGANGNPGSHRTEQSLFYLDGGQRLTLTDAAAIYLPGQLGHSRSSSAKTPITLTRFLMQRTPTGGEYTGAAFVVNDSAFIECPEDSATYIDGDNDALYIVDNVHYFTNTLFGWVKDDAIDSGGSGYGPLTYESCWFEGAFHEGNSLSGYKNTYARNTVYLDCGQGIEDGYDRPTGRVDRCVFALCKSGVRHGDNYESIGSEHGGLMTATDSIFLWNHRDLFGYNWRSTGWTNNWGRLLTTNNLLTTFDTNFPNNSVWDPASDGWRLAAYGGAGRVGIGFAVRPTQGSLTQFPNGIPVGLSTFCTNQVTVHYRVDGNDGTQLAGTLVFPAGLMQQHIPVPASFTGVLRVGLDNPVNADITSSTALFFQNIPSSALSPLGANWKYLDDGSEQGSTWRATDFNDSAWSNGVARLGFGSDAAANTIIRRYITGSVQATNYYFRRSFVVPSTNGIASLQFRYQRDDGCIVYLNGIEVFRNNMPAGAVTARTFSSSTVSGSAETLRFWTNTAAATFLRPGTNVLAAEVHQTSATSSDIAWDLELTGIVGTGGPRLEITRLANSDVLYWTDSGYVLEEATEVTGPWRVADQSSSPAGVQQGETRFYRLRR